MAAHRPLYRRAAGLTLLALGLLLALVACTRKPIQVVYYYKAGSSAVEQRIAEVEGLEKEFPGRLVARAIEASTLEAQGDLSHLDIGTSGIAVRNGNSILIFKQGESFMDLPAVRQAIKAEIAGPLR